MVDEARAAGPTLLVDSGDALFRQLEMADDKVAGADARAKVALHAMGKMKYAAMAVGERDLAHGWQWLQREADAVHLPLLAANLLASDGTHPFPGTRIVTEGGKKIGLFAVINAGDYGGGEERATDPVAAAKEAVAQLQKDGAELVVGLAHVDWGTSHRIATEVKGIDLIVLGHEGRAQYAGEVAGDALLLAGGDRGRQVGKLVLYTETRGKWANAGEGETALVELKSIQTARTTALERAKGAKSEAEKKSYLQVAEQQKKRAADVRAAVTRVPSGRLYKNQLVALDPGVKDEADTEREVKVTIEKWGDADAVVAMPQPPTAVGAPPLPILRPGVPVLPGPGRRN